MTGIAVVASAHDAKFAEEVRAALQAAGLDTSVSRSLPKAADSHVVLIWSAALEAGHAIDAQALIGLWSEDRLVTVRRDATPLPLGLRDLPSLPPSSTAEEISAAVPGARYTIAGPPAEVEQVPVGSMAGAATTGTGPTGGQEVEVEFWRAIKDGNDPDDFELYIRQFPTGIYVALAKRKIAKLRGIAQPGSEEREREQEQRELEEAARREAEIRKMLAEERAAHEATLSQGAAKEFSAAVLFADVSGGKQLYESAGERASKAAIDDCVRIMRTCIEAAKGRVVKIIGGEVMALFPSADAAADAAIEMQSAIADLKPVGNSKIGIRIGFNYGPIVEHADGEIFGDAVTVASRIWQVAVKGQIITGRDTVMSMAPMLKSATRKITAIQIKSKAADVEVYELMWKQGEDATTMAAARSVYKSRKTTLHEAARTRTETDVPRAKFAVGIVASVVIAIAAAGGGAWYYFNKSIIEKQAALTAALESATQASQELQQAQARQLEALKALEQARAAEVAARKAGDPEKLKEAQEAAKRAEAETAKQADAVKAREAAAADARKKAQEGAEKAKVSKAAEPMKAESVAVAPEPFAKAPEPAAKALEPVAKSAEPPRPKSRSEREREEEDRLAGQAALRRGPQVVASAPAPSSEPASAASSPTQQAADLFEQAQAMEASDPRGAVKIYRSLARNGNSAAAKRLGEIYDRGIPGVARDYAESLQWYETSRKLDGTTGTGTGMARARTGAAPEQGDGESQIRVTVQPAPAAIPEAAKSEPPKPAAVKSAPLVREPAKPALVPGAKTAPPPEPVKAVAPAPAPAAIPEPPKAAAPVPAPVPPKPAAEPAAPAHETKTGWFTLRGLLIALFVLALIAWRRSRRRQKAEARQAQRQIGVTADEIVPVLKEKAARSVYRPGKVAAQAVPSDSMLFVSYSHKDRPRVEPIVSVIEEMGRRVWIDRTDITGQTGWAGQIVRAIRECRAVVLMASPNSYTSDQVVRELYLAMNHRKTIVPIEIEPAEMPDELQYILAPFQHHRLSAGETRAVLGRALAAV